MSAPEQRLAVAYEDLLRKRGNDESYYLRRNLPLTSAVKSSDVHGRTLELISVMKKPYVHDIMMERCAHLDGKEVDYPSAMSYLLDWNSSAPEMLYKLYKACDYVIPAFKGIAAYGSKTLTFPRRDGGLSTGKVYTFHIKKRQMFTLDGGRDWFSCEHVLEALLVTKGRPPSGRMSLQPLGNGKDKAEVVDSNNVFGDPEELLDLLHAYSEQLSLDYVLNRANEFGVYSAVEVVMVDPFWNKMYEMLQPSGRFTFLLQATSKQKTLRLEMLSPTELRWDDKTMRDWKTCVVLMIRELTQFDRRVIDAWEVEGGGPEDFFSTIGLYSGFKAMEAMYKQLLPKAGNAAMIIRFGRGQSPMHIANRNQKFGGRWTFQVFSDRYTMERETPVQAPAVPWPLASMTPPVLVDQQAVEEREARIRAEIAHAEAKAKKPKVKTRGLKPPPVVDPEPFATGTLVEVEEEEEVAAVLDVDAERKRRLREKALQSFSPSSTRPPPPQPQPEPMPASKALPSARKSKATVSLDEFNAMVDQVARQRKGKQAIRNLALLTPDIDPRKRAELLEE